MGKYHADTPEEFNDPKFKERFDEMAPSLNERARAEYTRAAAELAGMILEFSGKALTAVAESFVEMDADARESIILTRLANRLADENVILKEELERANARLNQ
jgi:hypothetical protein